MRIVGIHLGHDAAIAEVTSDGVKTYLNHERYSKCKHALGLPLDALEEYVFKRETFVGVSSTQANVAIIDNPNNKDFFISSKYIGIAIKPISELAASFVDREYCQWIKNPDHTYSFLVDESLWSTSIQSNGNLRFHNGIKKLHFLPSAENFLDINKTQSFALQLHLQKNVVPGRYYMHHLSHAWYGFWASNSNQSLIISQDGGHSDLWDAGGYFLGSRQSGVKPLLPGGFWIGHFYAQVAKKLGVGDSGKLMGLAPYGKPHFFTEDLIGSISDIESKTGIHHTMIADWWLQQHCNIKAKKIEELGQWDKYSQTPPRIVADIAASAQKILEANIIKNIEIGLEIIRSLKIKVDSIILVGGVSLNCPANTYAFDKYNGLVHIPPACNDEGLAIGNAVAAYFDHYGTLPKISVDPYERVFLGAEHSISAINQATKNLKKISDFDPQRVAQLIYDGAIIGLYYGRSEIGPRALGHRSIMASPLIAENWLKVNQVKDREPWRPFAPICLEEEMSRLFECGDLKSRYMLFTHQVKTSALPAVTHYDRSARAQAATSSCGIAYSILQEFRKISGYGVLMNTSFNGKNVPIVETPQDAVKEALKIGLDYLICETGIFDLKNNCN